MNKSEQLRQYRQAEEIIADVMELPAAQRSAAVLAACGDDANLRQHVQDLIAAAEDADGFMSAPTVDAIDPATAPMTERPGTMIGRYKLLQQIGEGGFGVVFMAEQEKPVRRTVALKVIKLGMDTREVVARFEAERQALALMDHPNIAKVLDAGATDTGRPYFVMELVKGLPITEYADKKKLSTTERVALLAQVCRAVQHAHSKGVIHRDLKPSNVLVTTADDKPIPKVIDFGIAKATQSKLTDRTLFTQFRQLIGTPQYMSPEQADSEGVDVDTRTDVYSLGVLLYELLVGTTPLDAKQLRSAAYEEMRRQIRDVEPPRPSTRLHTLANDQQNTIATARSSDAKKLGQAIHGELDWIVMRALEKDRARRYESASALAEDLHRYLNGEAVLAGPVSGTYRLKKMLKRYKAGFIVGSSIAAVLLLGVAGTTWGLIREKHALAVAEMARSEADSERNIAVQARMEAEKQQKITEINAEEFQGDLLMEHHNPADAAVLLRKVWEFRRATLGVDDPRTVGVMSKCCLSYLGMARRSAARELINQAIAEDRQLGRVDEPNFSRLLYESGVFLSQAQDYSLALPILAEYVDRTKTLRDPVRADALVLLVDAKSLLHDHSGVKQMLADLASLDTSLTKSNPSLRIALYFLANQLAKDGDLPDAESALYISLDTEPANRPAAAGPPGALKNLIDVVSQEANLPSGSAATERLADFYKSHSRYALYLEQLSVELAGEQFRNGDLIRAKAAYAISLHFRPAYDNYYYYVRLCGYMGDVAEYRRVCQLMRAKFADSASINEREGTARACLMLPPATPEDLAGLSGLIGYSNQSDNSAWQALTESLLQYRMGHYDDALKLAEMVTSKLEQWAIPQSQTIQAMAKYQLGRRADANAQLAAVMTEVSGQVTDYSIGYLDREQLIREAVQLIGPVGSFDLMHNDAISKEAKQLEDAVAENEYDADAWQDRGRFYFKIGKFELAKSDYGHALTLRSGYNDYYQYVRLCGYLNDKAEYRRVCNNMIHQFDRGAPADVLEGTVRACLMLPPENLSDLDGLEEKLKLSQLAAPRSPWPVLTRALLQYRLGHYETALHLTQQASRIIPPFFQPQATALESMCLARLDRHEEAVAEFAKLQTATPVQPRAGVDLLVGDNWWGWLDREQLTREAGQLIDPTGEITRQTKATTVPTTQQ